MGSSPDLGRPHPPGGPFKLGGHVSKDIGVVIALPAELKHRIDAMAAQVGLTAHTLMLAWVLQGMKGPAAAPVASAYRNDPNFVAVSELPAEDAWRGDPNADEPEQPSNVDVDAMIASRVAEAESAGLAQPPGQAYEAFGPPTPAGSVIRQDANVRSLRRPPPQFAPANGPSHLRSL